MDKTCSELLSALKKQIPSLLIALVALVVSIISCNISRQAISFQEAEFHQNRLLTLTAVVDDENNVLLIRATTGEVTLLGAKATYPQELDDTNWSISSPDYGLHVTVLKHILSELLDRFVKRDPNAYKIVGDAAVPVIIDSEYLVRGIRYFDRSLYQIEYMAIINEKDYVPPKILIQGLCFLERLEPTKDKKEVLSEIWSKIVEHHKNGFRRPED